MTVSELEVQEFALKLLNRNYIENVNFYSFKIILIKKWTPFWLISEVVQDYLPRWSCSFMIVSFQIFSCGAEPLARVHFNSGNKQDEQSFS